MARRPNPDLDTWDDSGFTTAAFATLVFGFALIAAAGVMVASQALQAAKHDVRSDQEAYVLEGVAIAGAARLLAESEAPTLRWSEASEFGPLVVTLEPEALKLAPVEIGKPGNVRLLSQMFGGDRGETIAEALLNLRPAPDGVLHRSQIIEIDQAERWRECATTLISPYSRLSAFVLPPPRAPSGQGDDRHAGELWRVAVDAPDGTWLDQVVRMTGSSIEPVAIVEAVSGRTPGNHRTSCLSDLERLAGRPL